MVPQETLFFKVPFFTVPYKPSFTFQRSTPLPGPIGRGRYKKLN